MATDDSNLWESDPENIELMKFLIEKTKDVKSPMTYDELAEKYKEVNPSGHSLFKHRVRFLSGKIGRMEKIDNVTKVKLIFALSVNMSKFLFRQLKKDAYVKVDEQRRIIKYISNDGSVELEGEHQSKKSKARKENPESDESRNSESTKRAAPEVSDNSTKRARIDSMEPGEYAPFENHPLLIGSRSTEILDRTGVQSPQEPSKEPLNQNIQEFRDPKQEEESILAPETPEIPVVQIRGTLEFSEAPRTPEVPEAPDLRIGSASGAPEPPRSPAPAPEPSRAYTPQIKFLEALQSLVITLDTPTLSPLQENIEKKLRESPPDTKIPNDEIIPAMDLLIARITNSSVSNLSENVESVSLSHFLCYLKAAILNSKLEGLEGLLEKIKERIKEPASKDKIIPVEKVAKALQDTLNNVGF